MLRISPEDEDLVVCCQISSAFVSESRINKQVSWVFSVTEKSPGNLTWKAKPHHSLGETQDLGTLFWMPQGGGGSFLDTCWWLVFQGLLRPLLCFLEGGCSSCCSPMLDLRSLVSLWFQGEDLSSYLSGHCPDQSWFSWWNESVVALKKTAHYCSLTGE